MSARIDRILPTPGDDLDDEAILAAYAPTAGSWLRMNFVSSIDGAATHDGRSGGLGDEADQRVFALLRRQADVVLVGAGTIRIEEYDGFRLGDDDAAWRAARGMPEHPVLAIVSGSLDLDPASAVFTDAPVRPIVYTVAASDARARAALEPVADVVDAGEHDIDPRAVRDDLVGRGLARIHSEGGPHLFGSFIEAGVVDELCLTLAPSLQAGDAGRIARSDTSTPRDMRLAALLRSGDELFLRYRTR
ncbi:pyrimidine reductase family protein [Microbacterium pseudoresistens]|uniref:Riboflavin biosynthesis pyrimidine reductase n=1 Tax=Microbacterium pseudoresistens TaxID=640634 RepID=A0A7Y9EUK0_9MICO|nr:pyrimidine reductase family protein [Microbacterium pseudoresistens]NYD54046.1 riboflavin biosynthesis pyrimidine reductase [Microbacterium pseudoresistens]